jgi:hypothetical protein
MLVREQESWVGIAGLCGSIFSMRSRSGQSWMRKAGVFRTLELARTLPDVHNGTHTGRVESVPIAGCALKENKEIKT